MLLLNLLLRQRPLQYLKHHVARFVRKEKLAVIAVYRVAIRAIKARAVRVMGIKIPEWRD